MRRLPIIVATGLAVVGLLPAGAHADFGFAEADVTLNEVDGSFAIRAGAHPFALTTTLRLNTVEQSGLETPDEDLEELWIEYPPGLVAAPSAVPACPMTDFEDVEGDENDCPNGSAIGIAGITASTTGPIPAGTEDFLERVPVYRLPPDGGVGRIGLLAAGQPVTAELGLTEDEPYRSYLWVPETPESVLLYSARVTIWGTPADSIHDGDRGACALSAVGSCPVAIPLAPLLTAPRSCTGPLETIFEAHSRQELDQWISEVTLSHDDAVPPQPLGLTDCSQLAFTPQFGAQPTTDLAETRSGLEVSLDFFDHGLANPVGLAGSEAQEVLLTLPEGVTVDPAVADGVSCTPAQFAAEDIDPELEVGCPLGSEIGTVAVETPLLDGTVIEGKAFMAEPDDPTTVNPGAENPFDSALALYVVLRHPGFGILIKQAGEVEVDPVTEQLAVSFDQLPQIPISHLEMSLAGEDGGLLFTPAECGKFTTVATFTPWSAPQSAYLASTSFEIVAGPGNRPCPSMEESPTDPGTDDAGSPSSSDSSPVAPPLVPALFPQSGVKQRSCPKGKRRIGRKGRCVRKRCPRARKDRSSVRRCPRSGDRGKARSTEGRGD